MGRIIGMAGDSLSALKGNELKEAIAQSGGRTIAGEVVAFKLPIIDGVTNCELVAKSGCDIVHLNHYDVDKPVIGGMVNNSAYQEVLRNSGLTIESETSFEGPLSDYLGHFGYGRTIQEVKKVCSRVFGLSLELSDAPDMPQGRKAVPSTVEKAIEQGANYLAMIANSDFDISIVVRKLQAIKKEFGNDAVVLVGRMPWGALYRDRENFLNREEIQMLVEAGADIIMLPAPNTVIGANLETIGNLALFAKKQGALVEISIGTSQESSSTDVIERLALDMKSIDGDIYQIGDGGWGGIAPVENISCFAEAIKGKRHTIKRMIL